MATTKDNVQIKGRLVSDPTASPHANGPKSVFRFVEEDFQRDVDGNLTRNEQGFPIVKNKVFHDAVVWYAPLAERINETLRSGDSIIGAADLRFTSYEDKDGGDRTSHEFVVKSMGADLASGRVSISRGPKAPAQEASVQPTAEPTNAPGR